MPREQSFRSDDCGDLRQNLTSDPLGFVGKPTSLVVGKSELALTDLLTHNPIFLNEVLDHVLLPLVQPARNGNDEKRKWIQTRSPRVRVTCGSKFTGSGNINPVSGQYGTM
jgi:hypothetical protein